MTTVQAIGIEDIVSCPVCMDVYKKPKVLPCQHAFCLECVFTAYRDGCSVSPFLVKCPVCREEHVMRAFSMTIDEFDRQFPNHFVLMALLEAQEKASRLQMKRKSCDDLIEDKKDLCPGTSGKTTIEPQEDIEEANFMFCSSRRCPVGGPGVADAKWHCLMCDKQLCNECVYEHFNAYIEHEIINLGDQMMCYEAVLQRNATVDEEETEETDDAQVDDVSSDASVWEQMWKGYTDMLIRSSSCLIKAVIIGAYSAQVLGRSQPPVGRDFQTDANELRRICQIFRDIRLGSSSSPDNCVLEGVSYELGSARDNVLYGQRPGGGFFAMKTRVSIVVGVYAGDFQEAIAAGAAVQQIAEILKESYY